MSSTPQPAPARSVSTTQLLVRLFFAFLFVACTGGLSALLYRYCYAPHIFRGHRLWWALLLFFSSGATTTGLAYVLTSQISADARATSSRKQIVLVFLGTLGIAACFLVLFLYEPPMPHPYQLSESELSRLSGTLSLTNYGWIEANVHNENPVRVTEILVLVTITSKDGSVEKRTYKLGTTGGEAFSDSRYIAQYNIQLTPDQKWGWMLLSATAEK